MDESMKEKEKIRKFCKHLRLGAEVNAVVQYIRSERKIRMNTEWNRRESCRRGFDDGGRYGGGRRERKREWWWLREVWW
jgi:hypothetical protein